MGLEVLRFAVGTRTAQALAHSGETYGGDDALQRALVDELVPAEDLLARACAVANDLASVPVSAFAPTKLQLRQPALDAAEKQDVAQIAEIWSTPTSAAAIRSYLDRTLKKS